MFLEVASCDLLAVMNPFLPNWRRNPTMFSEKRTVDAFFAFIILFAPIFSACAWSPAFADIGPKATMEFRVKYSIPVVQVKSGQLMQSDKPDFSDAQPLRDLGPQGFHCDQPRWSALGYGFSDYSKLVIQFADKKRSSNVFGKKAFNAFYKVDVRENDLTVVEEPQAAALVQGGAESYFRRFALAATITIVVELILGAIFIAIARKPIRILGFILAGNLITLLAVWWVFPYLPLPELTSLLVSELFAWLGEAWFLLFMMKGSMRWWTALILCFVLNAVSGILTVLI